MSAIELNISTFRTLYPEFSSVTAYTDELLNAKYALGSCYICTDGGFLSTECRTQILMLMLAHLLRLQDLADSGAPAGQIVSASEDGVSVTLTPPPNNSQLEWWLNQTNYGQQINTLLGINSVGGFYFGGKPELSGFRDIGGGFDG